MRLGFGFGLGEEIDDAKFKLRPKILLLNNTPSEERDRVTLGILFFFFSGLVWGLPLPLPLPLPVMS